MDPMTTESSSNTFTAPILAMAANSGSSDSLHFPNIAICLHRTNYSLQRGSVRYALEAYDLITCLNPTTIPTETIIDQLATETTQATTKTNPAYTTWI